MIYKFKLKIITFQFVLGVCLFFAKEKESSPIRSNSSDMIDESKRQKQKNLLMKS